MLDHRPFEVLQHKRPEPTPPMGVHDTHLPDLDGGAERGVVWTTKRLKGRNRCRAGPCMVRGGAVAEEQVGAGHGHDVPVKDHPCMQCLVLIHEAFGPGGTAQGSTEHVVARREVGLGEGVPRIRKVHVGRHSITTLRRWRRSNR